MWNSIGEDDTMGEQIIWLNNLIIFYWIFFFFLIPVMWFNTLLYVASISMIHFFSYFLVLMHFILSVKITWQLFVFVFTS